MTYASLAVSLIVLVLVWDIRRALGLRNRPTFQPAARETSNRRDFRGAVPPNRYCVVRWPDGHHFYNGCVGSQARQLYEHTHPQPGEEVEFWELGDRRGHKAG